MEFLSVYLSHTIDNFREAESQWIRIVLQKMAGFHLLLYIAIKGGEVSGLHEIHC